MKRSHSGSSRSTARRARTRCRRRGHRSAAGVLRARSRHAESAGRSAKDASAPVGVKEGAKLHLRQQRGIGPHELDGRGAAIPAKADERCDVRNHDRLGPLELCTGATQPDSHCLGSRRAVGQGSVPLSSSRAAARRLARSARSNGPTRGGRSAYEAGVRSSRRANWLPGGPAIECRKTRGPLARGRTSGDSRSKRSRRQYQWSRSVCALPVAADRP